MRVLPEALAEHLASGCTTVCRCWLLTRLDGVSLGFTDHDLGVEIDGTTYSAVSGVDSSGDVLKSGFAVGGLEIEGALSSAGLDEEDLAAGLYDGANVELWLVNWKDVAERVLLRRGALGEVTSQDGAFMAEVRGPMRELETVRGRVYTHTCDADLGDARCKFDLEATARTAQVLSVDGTRVVVEGVANVPAEFFAHGAATVTTGEAKGGVRQIVRHRIEGTNVVLIVRSEIVRLAVGDRLSLVPGCDKRFQTCRTKFGNALNFQGFPHLPGTDRAFSYARSS